MSSINLTFRMDLLTSYDIASIMTDVFRASGAAIFISDRLEPWMVSLGAECSHISEVCFDKFCHERSTTLLWRIESTKAER